MTTLPIAFFVAATLTVAEALYLLARSSNRPDVRSLSLFLLFLSLLDIASGLAVLQAPGARSSGIVIIGVAAPLIPFFWLLFTADWGRDLANDPYRRTSRPWYVLAGLVGAGLAVLAVVSPAVATITVGSQVTRFRLIGFSFPLFVYFLTCCLFGLHNLEGTFRSALGSQRGRLRGGMLILSVLTGVAFFAATLALLFHQIDLWVLAAIAFVVPVAGALLVPNLLAFDPVGGGVVVTRRVASSSAVILLGGLYFVAIGVLREILSGDTLSTDRVYIVLAALLTLTLMLAVFATNRIRLPLRSIAGGTGSSEPGAVNTFLNEVVAHRTVEDLIRHVGLFLRGTFGVSQGHLIERGEDAVWRPVPFGQAERCRLEDDIAAVADWLHRYGRPILFEDLREQYTDGNTDIDWLGRSLGYTPGLIVPLSGRQALVGLLLVDTGETDEPQRDDLARFLETISGPLALAVQNSHFTEQLIRSRTQESFQKMSSFVLHDLKNSVGMLDLLLSNARTNLGNPEFQESMLATIKDAVRRQRRIIARLSDPDAAECLARESVDLRALIEQVIEKTQVRKINHVKLTETYTATPTITTDPGRLASILENLITNALEAMPAGGTLEVATEIAALPEGEIAAIRVTDSGCGMTADFIENELFQPFSSTKKKGMGIGMYQSRDSLARLGGTISVESAPGQGTTFTVRLPLP